MTIMVWQVQEEWGRVEEAQEVERNHSSTYTVSGYLRFKEYE